MEGRLPQISTSPSHVSHPRSPLSTDVIDPLPLHDAPVFGDQATTTPPTRPEDLPLLENPSSIPLTHPTLAEIPGLQSSSTNEVEHLNWNVPSAGVSTPPAARTLDEIELSADEIQDLFNE
jgi:hypothetical protein